MSAQFTLFFDGHLWVGVYEIDDGVLVVLVLAVGHRREVYRLRKQRQ